MRRKLAEEIEANAAGEESAGSLENLGDEIRQDLERLEVPGEYREVLAQCVVEQLPALGEDRYQIFLAGLVAGLDAHKEAQQEIAGSMRDLQELERLMGAFAGELSKLDEVLEVLAAYVCRMRSASPKANRPTRIFH